MTNEKKCGGRKLQLVIAVVSVVALLCVGVVSASVGGFWETLARYAGIQLGNTLSEKVDGGSLEIDMMGAAGDTYQDAKVYSKVISNTARISANIPCDGWLIKGVDYYVRPSTTANTATTSITLGIYANSTTTTVETSLATDTYSTSTAVYQTYVTADGAGVTCASGKYIGAVLGAARTSTAGVLNVEYLKYE